MQNPSLPSKNDLKVRCFHFSLDVISFVETIPAKTSSKIIIHQVLRSATSIGANLVEARASSSRLEFKKYYEISLKSANETTYWLELLRDAKLANEKQIERLLSEVKQLANMLGAGVIKLKKKPL